MTTLFIKQLIQNNQIWPRRRDLRRAIARAYNAFARQHPDWAAAYFDEYFLSRSLLPHLDNIEERVTLPTPLALAQAWVDQLPGFDETAKQRLIAEATPRAFDFLRLLNAELYPQQVVEQLNLQAA